MNQSVKKWLAHGHVKARQLIRGRFLKTGTMDAPMFQNPLLAHALGGYNGFTYCNTMAAFDHAIANGFQYFEVDFSYTFDDRLILCHGWSKKYCKHTGFIYSPEFKQMTYEMIMQKTVRGEPICDVRTFYQKIKNLPYWFEIDFHSFKGEAIKKRIRALLEDFQNDTKLLNRLLIQVYSEQMYKDIESVHHFRYYQYLVGGHMDQLDEILSFCLRNKIVAVAVRASEATPAVIDKIKSLGLFVLCYTVEDDVAKAKELLDMGVDSVCTDFITSAKLETYTKEQEKK